MAAGAALGQVRSAVLLVALALLSLQGCDSSDAADADSGAESTLIVLVSVENIASPFTTASGAVVDLMIAPAVFAVVADGANPIAIGSPASAGLEQLAEDGDPAALAAELEGAPGILDLQVIDTAAEGYEAGAIGPGARFEVELTLRAQDRLWFAGMFVQSNDIFISPAEPIAASQDVGGVVGGDSGGAALTYWDAGTEVNEAPGDGPNQAPRQTGPAVGLEEGGVVGPLNDSFTYPLIDSVVEIRIETLEADG